MASLRDCHVSEPFLFECPPMRKTAFQKHHHFSKPNAEQTDNDHRHKEFCRGEGVRIIDDQAPKARDCRKKFSDDHADDGEPNGHADTSHDVRQGGWKHDLHEYLTLGRTVSTADLN